MSCFQSVANDREFIDEMNGIEKRLVPAYQARTLPQYDVFLSHANADKEQFVDELNSSLEKLGVRIFYDKKSLEWGDKWKDRILEGTKKAEFAIIVISSIISPMMTCERNIHLYRKFKQSIQGTIPAMK